MGKVTGFLEYQRINPNKRPIDQRVHDFNEFELSLSEIDIQQQAARCMDCGVPFCHAYGCPLKNRIPDWNEMVYRGQWKRALDLLQATNNFPEITGRVCPELCEAACILAINQPAVTTRQIELQIVERGFREGWILPEKPNQKTGKRIAIIGSGPTGLATAQQLARLGHEVVVFEQADRIGGILRYGIPDFKLEKSIIDRRLQQMTAEGVIFEPEVTVGVDISIRYLQRSFQAIIIAAGATVPRDLDIPGRQLKAIHLAKDFLTQQNRKNAGDVIAQNEEIYAQGKKVVVIGGGDTGADCVGTAKRQGASSITQIELLPQPPTERAHYNPWPAFPLILKTSSSHEEGCERLWSILAKEFIGDDNGIQKLRAVKIAWSEPNRNGTTKYEEIPNSEFELDADLALLATGFTHVEHGSLVHDLGLTLDNRGNIMVDADYMTCVAGVFAAGDAVLGPSLVVKAIHQGRQVAEGVDRYLL
jgi:NAD(P)H-dependent glutamate synthase small subunit